MRSALKFGDDPNGWMPTIKDSWVVTHRILTGVYGENGELAKKPYTVIRVGDFVEVGCTVEVVKLRKVHGWKTESRLILQEVMRVCEKNTVKVCDSHSWARIDN